MSDEARYPIGAAARMTGLTVDTLRAWERRYGAVVPQRGGRGRSYSDDDVARLILLRSLVERGHAIGTIASMDGEALRRLAEGPATPAARTAQTADSIDITPLTQAIARYDRDMLARRLGRLSVALSPHDFVFDVVIPVLTKVGDDWEAGHLRPSQEHLLSEAMRDTLGGLLRALARTDVPAQLVFATPSGEQHEFGILAAAVLAASRGLGVLYLGANLPAEDMVHAARHVRPQALVIGMTITDGACPELVTLAKRLPHNVEIWAGGASHEGLVPDRQRIVALADMRAFEKELARVPKTVF